MDQYEIEQDEPDREVKVKYSIEKWASQVTRETKKKGSNQTSDSKRVSIYMVSPSMKAMNKEAYKPERVSIGPYHHGNDLFKDMEKHKQYALIHFLDTSKKPLQGYIDDLRGAVDDLKGAYDQLADNWSEDNDAFLQLMIVDGCFILELLRYASNRHKFSKHTEIDPVFSYHGELFIVPHLKRDMLLLENQLPIRVLMTLLNDEEPTKDDNYFKQQGDLVELIRKFFSLPPIKDKKQDQDHLHILDVYRKSLLSGDHRPVTEARQRVLPKNLLSGDNHSVTEARQRGCSSWVPLICIPESILTYERRPPSAAELDEAGVRIKRNDKSSLDSISFRGGCLKGFLELPTIDVDGRLETLFLNLMAFERSRVGVGNEVTSYVFFMRSLIYSPKDVSVLKRCGVLRNAIGTDKAVAGLFNSLSKDITRDTCSSLDSVLKKVTDYYRLPLRLGRAEFIRTYFPSRRVGLSVYLFVLTALQTLFAVLSYRPK